MNSSGYYWNLAEEYSEKANKVTKVNNDCKNYKNLVDACLNELNSNISFLKNNCKIGDKTISEDDLNKSNNNLILVLENLDLIIATLSNKAAELSNKAHYYMNLYNQALREENERKSKNYIRKE